MIIDQACEGLVEAERRIDESIRALGTVAQIRGLVREQMDGTEATMAVTRDSVRGLRGLAPAEYRYCVEDVDRYRQLGAGLALAKNEVGGAKDQYGVVAQGLGAMVGLFGDVVLGADNATRSINSSVTDISAAHAGVDAAPSNVINGYLYKDLAREKMGAALTVLDTALTGVAKGKAGTEEDTQRLQTILKGTVPAMTTLFGSVMGRIDTLKSDVLGSRGPRVVRQTLDKAHKGEYSLPKIAAELNSGVGGAGRATLVTEETIAGRITIFTNAKDAVVSARDILQGIR